MSTFESSVYRAAALHAELLRTLAETDHASPVLEQQSRLIDDLDSHIAVSNQRLKVLEVKREADRKELGKFRNSYVRRFMYRAACQQDKFTHRAEKGEREFFEVTQKAQREHNINTSLREQRLEAERSKEELESMVEQHNEALEMLDKLYQSVFAGRTPQSQEEDEAEQMCDRLKASYQNLRAEWQAESMAVHLLENSHTLMDEALTRIRDALSYSKSDRLGGSVVYDMMEKNRLAQAEQLVAMARLEITRAQKVSPHVKAPAGVSINHGRVLRGLYYDDIFSDSTFRNELRRGVSEMQRCDEQLQCELDAARSRRKQLQAMLDCRAVELKEARLRLQREREKVFETVMRGSPQSEGRLQWSSEDTDKDKQGKTRPPLLRIATSQRNPEVMMKEFEAWRDKERQMKVVFE
ncbi:hypothetical protein HIM_06074 [Hirsutella minnesotensis 3608]|uniref:Uncharacterized protein n=1 Tax=Hirsutella minnesotensis 3608 TaxID=1043627 RepID=A0A0F7ZU96_9HYPO|nr:hypothetical protein HIM_06074 [Hirsutella minnesotensis 3608]